MQMLMELANTYLPIFLASISSTKHSFRVPMSTFKSAYLDADDDPRGECLYLGVDARSDCLYANIGASS